MVTAISEKKRKKENQLSIWKTRYLLIKVLRFLVIFLSKIIPSLKN